MPKVKNLSGGRDTEASIPIFAEITLVGDGNNPHN